MARRGAVLEAYMSLTAPFRNNSRVFAATPGPWLISFSLDRMNSVSQRRSRTAALVVMIVGALLTVTPIFGPLRYTLNYVADFIAERPQSMQTPDISFFAELLALVVCPIGLLMLAISLFFFIRSGRPVAPRA